VNLRVTGVGPISRPGLHPVDVVLADAEVSGGPSAQRFAAAIREVCFDAAVGYQPTPIYWRPDLPADAVVAGPAVIEEYGSTMPVHPGFTARVDRLGNLVVEHDR
jgi:N-methylhydantoinase A